MTDSENLSRRLVTMTLLPSPYLWTHILLLKLAGGKHASFSAGQQEKQLTRQVAFDNSCEM